MTGQIFSIVIQDGLEPMVFFLYR